MFHVVLSSQEERFRGGRADCLVCETCAHGKFVLCVSVRTRTIVLCARHVFRVVSQERGRGVQDMCVMLCFQPNRNRGEKFRAAASIVWNMSCVFDLRRHVFVLHSLQTLEIVLKSDVKSNTWWSQPPAVPSPSSSSPCSPYSPHRSLPSEFACLNLARARARNFFGSRIH